MANKLKSRKFWILIFATLSQVFDIISVNLETGEDVPIVILIAIWMIVQGIIDALEKRPGPSTDWGKGGEW